MSDEERVRLGRLIATRRKSKFGTARAAYEAAGVNSGTWQKAEKGASIREDRMVAIVRLLWPETDGDWTLVPSVGPTAQADHQYVSSSASERVEGGKQDAEVLRAITAMSARLDQLVAGQRDAVEGQRQLATGQRDLAERLDALEAGHDARLTALESRLEQLP